MDIQEAFATFASNLSEFTALVTLLQVHVFLFRNKIAVITSTTFYQLQNVPNKFTALNELRLWTLSIVRCLKTNKKN
jgi:hypothetical protein